MKFMTWKKIILIALLSQLAYTPCDINGQSKKNVIKENSVDEDTPDFLTTDPKISKKEPVSKWNRFHKSIYNFSGWGGPPEMISEGDDLEKASKKDFYYMRIQAKASSSTIEKDSPAQMMSSCQDSAKLSGVESSYRLFINDYLSANPPDEKRGSIVYNNISRATHYSCKYGPDDDKQIKAKDCKGFIKDHGIAVCWPRGKENSWAACECLTYIKVEGGKNALRAMINYE